jgi:hypothetical protein
MSDEIENSEDSTPEKAEAPEEPVSPDAEGPPVAPLAVKKVPPDAPPEAPPVELSEPPPRVYVAFIRLIGGLLGAALGGVLLHLSHDDRDLVALGITLSVGGSVMCVWGFVDTYLHRNSTLEDRFWAFSFLLLWAGSAYANVFFNHGDFGIRNPVEELIAVALALCGGLLATVVLARVRMLDAADTLTERRNALFTVLGVALPLWIVLRAVLSPS